MNTSEPTFLPFCCILLALYLSNALSECSCYIKIPIHLSFIEGSLYTFLTKYYKFIMSTLDDFLFLDFGKSKIS